MKPVDMNNPYEKQWPHWNDRDFRVSICLGTAAGVPQYSLGHVYFTFLQLDGLLTVPRRPALARNSAK